MGRFHLFRHLLASTGGGGGSPAVPLDTRYGTAQDSTTNRFTFALKPGCRAVYLDTVNGSDVNNGLSAAAPKKTIGSFISAFTTGFTPGDHMRIAEGSVIDDSSGSLGLPLNALAGDSLTYPCVIESYDPADPTNAAKYGWAHGANKPKLILSTQPSAGGGWLYTGTGSNWFWQGLRLYGSDSVDNYCGVNGGYQNCIFEGVRHKFINTANPHESLSSFFGQWAANGNTSGTYESGTTSYFSRDTVKGHCGWSMSASRDFGTAQGGTEVLSHADYYGGDNTGAQIYTCLGFDNGADSHSHRGSGTSWGHVSWRDPSTGSGPNFSGLWTEEPAGTVLTARYWASFVGNDIKLKSGASWQRGNGAGMQNSASGTSFSDCAWFDSQFIGLPAGNHDTRIFDDVWQSSPAGQPVLHCTFNNIRSYNWSKWQVEYNPNPTNFVSVWSNSITEASLGAMPGTNNSTWASPPPNYKNEAAIVSAMGFASREDLWNWALEYPEIMPWCQLINAIALQGMGITPPWAGQSVPSLAGYATPPQRYVPGASAPTLTLPTATSITTTTATIGATTDGSTGSMWWIVTTDAGTPTIAQIRAGQNSTGAAANKSGTFTVSSSGAKSVTPTGLTTATGYHYWFIHVEGSAAHFSSSPLGGTFTTA